MLLGSSIVPVGLARLSKMVTSLCACSSESDAEKVPVLEVIVLVC